MKHLKRKVKIYTHACSLDCYDLCKFKVIKKGGSIKEIVGAKDNKFTKGIICQKGRAHLARLYDKTRLLKPRLKVNGNWKEIEFEEAIDIIADKLTAYKKEFKSTSIAYYEESGAGGTLKGIPGKFFNFFGGVTTSLGSNCWGAGTKATLYDFGDARTSDLEETQNAKTIILWGRNPFSTSIHLYERMLKAKKNGVKIITIDPRVNETSKISHTHVLVKPSTDGAMAMAITKLLIEEKKLDSKFIEENIYGYDEYKSYLDTLDLNYLIGETGLDLKTIHELKDTLLAGKVSCFIGYGMQRYSNSGNAVRAINALMSLTKNIGIEGSGVFYSNRVYSNLLNDDPFKSESFKTEKRTFYVSEFADFIEENHDAHETPLKSVFIAKCNPLSRYANLNKLEKAYEKIEFKVCIDMFMTDTARASDLVIPCTNTLESEDIISSGMHNPHLLYNEKVVEPANKLMDEYYFFQKLAEVMEMKEYPQVGKEEYINKILSSVSLDIEKLKKQEINLSKDEIAWSDFDFPTPSGKIEIYSEEAKKDGLSPYPVYIESLKISEEYPMRLISPHHKNSLFGQHTKDMNDRSKLYVSPNRLKGYEVGEVVKIYSVYGEIETEIHVDETLSDDLVYIYAIWSKKNGNPNFLTYNGKSEMGGQVTFYDTFINIRKNN